ncbi:MAG: YIP1 family protein, partial [Burkholderiaceae bacterium]|nr:YIP1 family protein [Burkholderiaceae bacterium]
PALAGFIQGSLIGYNAFGVSLRVPVFNGLLGAILGYVLGLAAVYVMALIVDTLAPTFGGRKNLMQAIKVVAYSWSAVWVAAVGSIIPWLGWLIYLAGAVYSVMLLYWGLPVMMQCRPEKAGGYTALTCVCGLALSLLIALMMGGITGARMMTGGGASGTGNGQATSEQNSWLGKVTAAGAQMEEAQKSGDADAQAQAMGDMLSATLGGGDKVEALAPDVLKPFLPETLAGLKRSSFSAERNGALGMQVAKARATYSDDSGRALRLEISDMGSIKGLASLAGLAGLENNEETDHGYDKTYKQGDRIVREQWDSQSKDGEFSVMLADRFSVKVSGNAASIDDIKAAVASLNLEGLEALKNQGVQKD